MISSNLSFIPQIAIYFGDEISTRREVFIPLLRTPSLHVTQHSLAKMVFEESSKGLISLGTVFEDHAPAIKAPNIFSETGDFVIILLTIRIILTYRVTILTS